jgi:hypothetical protein
MRTTLIALLLACGCTSRPLLAGLPRPNPAVAAGIAAGAAAAATIADPTAAQRQKEAATNPPPPPKLERGEPMPDDVLDRLEEAERAAAAGE